MQTDPVRSIFLCSTSSATATPLSISSCFVMGTYVKASIRLAFRLLLIKTAETSVFFMSSPRMFLLMVSLIFSFLTVIFMLFAANFYLTQSRKARKGKNR
jgi:hypothetical protein